MAKYKIEHDRPNCIGCTACVGINPDLWEMDPDGKSNVKGSFRRPDGWEELALEEKDFNINKEAADACPVNVIHIIDTEKKEKVI
jgi:ferredoxin